MENKIQKNFRFSSKKQQSIVRLDGKKTVEEGETIEEAERGCPIEFPPGGYGEELSDNLTTNIYPGVFDYPDDWEADETISPPSPIAPNTWQQVNGLGDVAFGGHSGGNAYFHRWDHDTVAWNSNVVWSNTATWGTTTVLGVGKGPSYEFVMWGAQRHTSTNNWTAFVYDTATGAAARIAADSGVSRFRVHSALDADNVINTVVLEGPFAGTKSIRFSYNKGSFSTISTITPSGDLEWPKIAVDLVGRVYVSYHDDATSEIKFVYTDDPTVGSPTWSSPVAVVTATSGLSVPPEHDMFARTGVYIGYQRHTLPFLKYAISDDQGTNWFDRSYTFLGFNQTSQIKMRFGSHPYGQREFAFSNLSLFLDSDSRMNVYRAQKKFVGLATEVPQWIFQGDVVANGILDVEGGSDGALWATYWLAATTLRKKREDTFRNPANNIVAQVPGTRFLGVAM